MNDIVQSQEKSMEGHLQVLFKVRGLKSKSLVTKYEAPMKFCGAWGGASNQKRAMEGTWIFSVEVWTN